MISVGAMLASVMGTTGAAMLMVRPLIRANDDRPRAAHVFVFFIFIVANAAGALTPLGDPPLFLGYLNDVPFDWPLRHLWAPTALLVGALLALFVLIDAWFERRDGRSRVDPTPDAGPLRLEGRVNIVLLAAAVACVLGLRGLVRDAALVGLALLSLALTPRGVRAANGYSWAPLREVAVLFLGIFVTMLPALAMLRAGEQGAFAALIRETAGPSGDPLPFAYFWLSGALSAVLDNAPTYLVFFNLAGGDVARLAGPLAQTLAAISAGSVFMGAYTYIGNAPNLMVKAVAEHHGIRMPGFFGYVLWSGIILSPLFLVISLLWFR
jgi:Na+/H+ antiporter NhaD/arsenite permease-like protein